MVAGTKKTRLRLAARGGARACLDARSRQPELQLPLDAARARPRAAREEERVVAALDEHARVGLEHVLVEAVLEAPVDAVRAEVVHEEREHRVGEEVLAGAVGGGRQARALEREAEDDRVEVRQVRRHEDEGALLGQSRAACRAGPSTTTRPSSARRSNAPAEVPQRRHGRHEQADERGRGARRELVDARVEVAGDVPRVAVARARAGFSAASSSRHPPEGSRRASATRAEARRRRCPRLLALDLEERRLVQEQERVARAVAHAPRRPRRRWRRAAVEPEDGGDTHGARSTTCPLGLGGRASAGPAAART